MLRPRLIGVIHLASLPSSPGYGGSMDAILKAAVADAVAYAEGGADAVIVENFGDAPFLKAGLAPATVAAMTACAAAVRDSIDLPLGINALRNDALAALAVATAVGAKFIRVNVLAGVVATDQGLIEGDAAALLRTRVALLADDIEVWADVHVKHAKPLFADTVENAAKDLVQRSKADALIASGAATGEPTDVDQLRRLRDTAPDARIYVGSGVTLETAAQALEYADGIIVGTALKVDGDVGNAVDPRRVKALSEAISDLG